MMTKKVLIIISLLFIQLFSSARAEEYDSEQKKQMSKGEMIAIVYSLDEESLLGLLATTEAELESRFAPHEGVPLTKYEDDYLNK